MFPSTYKYFILTLTNPSNQCYNIIYIYVLSEKREKNIYVKGGGFMDRETIKLLSDLLDEKLEPIKARLDEHSSILNEHSAILKEHSSILNKHSSILNEHSAVLKEHSEILNKHSAILNEHSSILNEHSSILNEHSEILKVHSIKLDEHTQILRALEHSAQANKAEQDKMTNDIARIQGDIESIKKGLAGVELITANNWADIVKIKSLIQ